MSTNTSAGMPRGVALAINDLIDNVARIESGQEVLLLAHNDGLHGSDNLVDTQAISWIQSAIHQRGANASVLWIDEPDRPHEWRIPPVLRAAMQGCDVFINHSFNLVTEDIRPLRNYFMEQGIRYVRNFATTSKLLNTPWAQTPSELVDEIRFQAAVPFEAGQDWSLKDDNGTHLEGRIAGPSHMWFPTYAGYRQEAGGYLPWPDWAFPPINLEETNGELIFDRMLSWWSRYIGIPPFFNDPIRLTIREGLIKSVDGGSEAEALKRFMKYMKDVKGVARRDEFNTMHGGVHPNARVGSHQCPNINYRRLVEHGHTSNIHFHIGSEHVDKSEYPYWLHVTGDIRNATWKVGDILVHDKGRLTALDHPKVKEIAEKFPDRPGLESLPWQY